MIKLKKLWGHSPFGFVSFFKNIQPHARGQLQTQYFQTKIIYFNGHIGSKIRTQFKMINPQQNNTKYIRELLSNFANKEKAIKSSSYFKTDKGSYGEGDVFIGVTMPQIRSIVKQYWKEVSLINLQHFLHSKIHEERLLALLFLVQKFEKAIEKRNEIVDFYLHEDNLKYINNWDLVDVSCYKIIGIYFNQNPEKVKILYDFASSDNLWKRRIGIISTLAFIRNKEFVHTINIAKLLINDKHDLIHKAVGWMLREVGKRDKKILINFLNQHGHRMARTSWRYAVQKLTDDEKNNIKKKKKKSKQIL